MRLITDDPAFRKPEMPGGTEGARAVEVITSSLLDRIASGGIGCDGRVPPFAMAAAGAAAGVSTGALRYAPGQLVADGALRLEPGRGYYLRSRAALAAAAEEGAR